MRARLGHLLGHAAGSVEQEIVDRAGAQLLESLVGERLDGFHVVQLERHDGDRVLAVVVREPIVGVRRCLDVARTENQVVGL